jgi:hypothetical protein
MGWWKAELKRGGKFVTTRIGCLVRDLLGRPLALTSVPKGIGGG